MLRRRSLRARGFFAALLSLSLGLSAVEANIADVHDGDAPVAEVARADGPVEAHCVSVRPTDQPSAPDHSTHLAHVCHAGHAHTGWIGTPSPVATPASPVTAVHDAGPLAVADFDPTPAVRPPIA